MNKLLKLVLSIGICQMSGIVGSFFTISSISNWYQYLNKPSFSPPNYLFGPVWLTLYTLMGISLYLIWDKGLKNKTNKAAVQLFLIHLVVNASWSIIFFELKNIFLALVVIILLLIMIVKVIKAFSKIDKRASWLLYPYLAWVSFASVLNFSIWLLNR